LLNSILIVASLYVFGEPYAPGWTTAALPLALAYVISGYPDPDSRFQAMTALSLSYAGLVFALGITGLGRRLMRWLPSTLKAGILLGAALSACRRVLTDKDLVMAQPIATAVACAVCLVFLFSVPFRSLIERHRPL